MGISNFSLHLQLTYIFSQTLQLLPQNRRPTLLCDLPKIESESIDDYPLNLDTTMTLLLNFNGI